MSLHPTILWAQRLDKVFITIELPDAKNVKLTLQPDGRFYFSATTGLDNIQYEVDMLLFDKVDVQGSKASIGLRNIFYILKKADKKSWRRLLKQEGKPPIFLKIDWNKWSDEEDDKDGDMGSFGDMDFSKLGMSGGGGGDADFDMDAHNVDEGEEQKDVKAEETNTSSSKDPEEAEANV